MGSFPRIKRPGHESNQSPPSCTKVKMSTGVPPTPHKHLWLAQGLYIYHFSILLSFMASNSVGKISVLFLIDVACKKGCWIFLQYFSDFKLLYSITNWITHAPEVWMSVSLLFRSFGNLGTIHCSNTGYCDWSSQGSVYHLNQAIHD